MLCIYLTYSDYFYLTLPRRLGMDRYYMPVSREEDDSIDHQYKVSIGRPGVQACQGQNKH